MEAGLHACTGNIEVYCGMQGISGPLLLAAASWPGRNAFQVADCAGATRRMIACRAQDWGAADIGALE